MAFVSCFHHIHFIDVAFSPSYNGANLESCPIMTEIIEHEEPLGERICMMVLNTISWLWRTACWAVIALALIPLPPFQWWALYTAVSHGRVRTVKLLARRWVFAMMPASVNAKMMLRAGYRASTSDSTDANKQIFKWLLTHGGIISQKSFLSGWLYTYFSLSTFACLENWVELAVEHNAIADDTKYELLLHCVKHSYYGCPYVDHKPRYMALCTAMIEKWRAFFHAVQEGEDLRVALWDSVLKDGSPETMNALLRHTPVLHVVNIMERVVRSKKCTAETLNAVANHMDVQDVLNQLHERYSAQFRNPPNFETWLSENFRLSEAYTIYCNQEQHKRLRQHIEEYEPAVSKRKM